MNEINSLTPEQVGKLFQGCLILLSGFALSIGMGFLLGQAGGWLTFAFLCVVFAFGLAHLRRAALEKLRAEATDKPATDQEPRPGGSR